MNHPEDSYAYRRLGAGKMGCIAVQDLAMDERVEQVWIADRDDGQDRTVAELSGSAFAKSTTGACPRMRWRGCGFWPNLGWPAGNRWR